jgi:hypothetical protein
MKLDQDELEQLAQFFAKRLTVSLEPADQDDGSTEKRRADWLRRLTLAQSKGRLPSLAKKIAKTDTSDTNLQEAALLLGLQKLPVAPFVMVAAMLIASIVFMGNDDLMTPEISPEIEAVPMAIVVDDVLEAEPMQTVAKQQPVVSEPVTGVGQVPETIATTEPVVVAPKPVANRRRCNRLPKGMVVYWYAGESSPGGIGDVIEVERARNAREDYPDRHNKYNARATIQCILVPGQRIKLAEEPMLVPGDRYWVSLRASDMVQ